MSQRQHLTTRRAFITALGFGGVSLYGAWAVYGAAPLPFFGSTTPLPPTASQAHGGHGGGGVMTPEEFLRNHEEFIARSELPDGSVVPQPAESQLAAGPTMPPMSTGEPMPQMSTSDHDSHGTADMPAMEPESDTHEAAAIASTAAPVDVYLLAYRFGFAPEELRLEAGKAYRFRMMASDIMHGASLSFGGGSRIIRLRPNIVSEQTITFLRPGPVLVYCTVFCGAAHDAMKARILVA